MTPGQIKYRKYRESNLRNKREYYQKNKERIKEYQAKYRAENPEKRYQTDRKYRQTHRDECNIKSRARAAKVKGKIIKEEITNWDTGLCGICDKLLGDTYEIDHIIPLKHGGEHKAENLQLAHKRCNRVKKDKIGFTLKQGKDVPSTA